jgi:HD-GYP domain-containing protein (c-di-GMP phosphodiesterase class II)
MKIQLGSFNSPPRGYVVSICITVAALLLHLTLVKLVGSNLPTYIFFYPAVIIAALFAGFGAGLLAAAMTALLADYWIIPLKGFTISSLPDAKSLAIFLFNGVLISVIAELYRRARTKAAELVLGDDRKRAEEERKQSVERMRKALRATVQSICLTVEMKDPYTSGHQQRVSDLARSIATEMGLSADRQDFIRTASTIHDIGKIAIPTEILSKPTKLTDLEFNLIKTHSQAGYGILKDIEFPWPVADVVLQHHERMDGSGSPQGLKGNDILLEARILAVADVVEAIASHRPYRPAPGIEIALEEIEKNKGILYDNTVANACLRLFREKSYQLP